MAETNRAGDCDNMIEAVLTAEKLKRLYAELENEFRPYELRVSAPENGRRTVRLYCLDANRDYFKRMLENGTVQAEI